MTADSKKGKPERSNKLVKIRGILIPMDWDGNGRVTAIGLSSRDEKEYWIENNDGQEKLLEIIQKEVEVSGLLHEQAGRSKILLKGYRKI